MVCKNPKGFIVTLQRIRCAYNTIPIKISRNIYSGFQYDYEQLYNINR